MSDIIPGRKMTDENDNDKNVGNNGDKVADGGVAGDVTVEKSLGWFKLQVKVPANSQVVGIADEFGKYLREKIILWRMDNLTKILTKVEEMVGEAQTCRLPLKTALESAEAASLADDDNLQTLWANLLAQYLVSGAEKRESFVGILHQLTPLEAQIFKALYEKQRKLKPEWQQRAWLGKDEVMERFNLSEDDYVVAHQDMLRIGIISRPTEKYLMRYEFFTPHNYTMPISEMGVAFGDYVIAPSLARGGGEPEKGAG